MLLPALLEVESCSFCRIALDDFVRPRGTQLHPGNEIGDEIVRELLFRGHLKVGIFIANGLDEQALFRLAGHNSGTCIAAFDGPLAGVQMKAALEFLTRRTVALITTIDQNRANLLFEEFDALRRGGLAGLDCGQRKEKERDPKTQRPPARCRAQCLTGRCLG